jgi:hypothetical protein
MAEKTVSAANSPGLANKLAQEAIAEQANTPQTVQLKVPTDVVVDLPGGYISPDGEVYRTAEVKELTGRDEELIVKSTTIPKAMSVALNRGTVKIGDVQATEEVLDRILAADRDSIMLGIYRATFGDVAEVGSYCSGCKDVKTVAVNVLEDIPVKILVDPIEDRRFKVQGRKSEFTVKLPEGKAQRELVAKSDSSNSELDTLLLEYCVVDIDGRAVLSKQQVQAIGLADRRKILEEIIKRNPGPQFDDLSVDCQDCGGKVVVPISLGTLFRF